MRLRTAEIESPIGAVRIAASETGLCAVDYADRWEVILEGLGRRFGDVAFEEAGDPFEAAERLERYFAGDLRALDGLPVDAGGTEFQRRVWTELRTIPTGSTTTYGELAGRLGNPTGSRAVGAANGRNPVAIVVPCHRVIAAGGGMCGYAGGVERKRWLLAHEGAIGARLIA